MIPDFKNAVNQKGAWRDCGKWWTNLSNKNCWFPKHKDGREENGNEGNINTPKAVDERTVKGGRYHKSLQK